MLADICQTLQKQYQVGLQVDEEAEILLAKAGYNPQYGARGTAPDGGEICSDTSERIDSFGKTGRELTVAIGSARPRPSIQSSTK